MGCSNFGMGAIIAAHTVNNVNTGRLRGGVGGGSSGIEEIERKSVDPLTIVDKLGSVAEVETRFCSDCRFYTNVAGDYDQCCNEKAFRLDVVSGKLVNWCICAGIQIVINRCLNLRSVTWTDPKCGEAGDWYEPRKVSENGDCEKSTFVPTIAQVSVFVSIIIGLVLLFAMFF